MEPSTQSGAVLPTSAIPSQAHSKLKGMVSVLHIAQHNTPHAGTWGGVQPWGFMALYSTEHKSKTL